MAAASPDEAALAILKQHALPAGQVHAGTCLPRLFSSETFLKASEAVAAAEKLVISETGVEDPVREIPLAYFSEAARVAELRRPDQLPPGFYIRRTPAEMSTSFLERRKDNWTPNMFLLVMGPGYRPLYLRHVRNAEPWPAELLLPVDRTGRSQPPSEFVYAEFIFGAYCITFHRRMLDAPGVRFTPLFVPVPPTDPNWWLRRDGVLDAVAMCNVVPPIPPGVCLAFGRLCNGVSVKKGPPNPDRPGEFQLLAGAGHPIVAGHKVFDPALVDSGVGKKDPAAATSAAAATGGGDQDGSVGYIVFRPNFKELGPCDERQQPGQRVVLYARCAFGPGALESLDHQRARIQRAVRYALANAPRASSGEAPAVVLDAVSSGWGEQCLPPQDLEKILAWTAVDARAQAAAQITRWLRAANPAFPDDKLELETAFRMKLAEELLTLKEEEAAAAVHKPVSVQLGLGTRVFEAAEIPAVLAMVRTALERAEQWARHSLPSPAFYYLAPPDLQAFQAAGNPAILCVGLTFRVALGHHRTAELRAENRPAMLRAYRTLADVGTRLQWDMQLAEPQLLVVSTARETHLLYMTDKAPGILNVHSAKTGLPPRRTETSALRRVKDPSPALTNFVVELCDELLIGTAEAEEEEEEEDAAAAAAAAAAAETAAAVPPHLSKEEAAANVMLRMWVKGPPLPTAVPGTEVSIYLQGTKCGCTHFAGTGHAWPAYGALVETCLLTPRSEDSFPWGYFGPEVDRPARLAALDVLYPPLYNTAKGQVWFSGGRWQDASFQPRKWQTAYGVSPGTLRRAAFFLLYPATPSEYDRPLGWQVWQLKQACEAVLHFMSRYGRIIRNVLVNRRRAVRNDFYLLPLNDVWRVKREVPPGSPVADVCVSVFNLFRDNLLVGEQPRRAINIYDALSNPGLGTTPLTGSGGGSAAAAPAAAASKRSRPPPAAAAAAAAPDKRRKITAEEQQEASVAELLAAREEEDVVTALLMLEDDGYEPTAEGSVVGTVFAGPDTMDLARYIWTHTNN